jgi:hypothetical protein
MLNMRSKNFGGPVIQAIKAPEVKGKKVTDPISKTI